MDELIIVFGCLGLGFYLGWRMRERYAKFVIQKYFNEANPQHEDDGIVNVEITKENNCFYVYNTKSGAFLTQVKSKEELLKYLETHYSEKTVMIKKEHFALFDAV